MLWLGAGANITQYLDDLLGALGPRHGGAVDFFEGVDDALVVQGDVGDITGGTKTRIKGSVPLFVFIAEANDSNVSLLNEGLNTNGIDLGGFMIAPKAVTFFTEMVAGRIARGVVGVGGAKLHF